MSQAHHLQLASWVDICSPYIDQPMCYAAPFLLSDAKFADLSQLLHCQDEAFIKK
jgi:hypothetical protein